MNKDNITDYWTKAIKVGKILHIMMQVTDKAAKECNLIKEGKQEFMDTGIEINVKKIYATYSLFEIDGTDDDNLYQKYIKVLERLQKLRLGVKRFFISHSK